MTKAKLSSYLPTVRSSGVDGGDHMITAQHKLKTSVLINVTRVLIRKFLMRWYLNRNGVAFGDVDLLETLQRKTPHQRRDLLPTGSFLSIDSDSIHGEVTAALNHKAHVCACGYCRGGVAICKHTQNQGTELHTHTHTLSVRKHLHTLPGAPPSLMLLQSLPQSNINAS